MKKVRALKDGIAILLAILIIIYVASLFFKFKPDEIKVEKGISKLYQFFNGTQSNRDYARLAILFFLSGLIGIVFQKQPALSLFASASLFAYTLTMYSNKQLIKRPMVIVILCLMHLIGNIMYCAMYERKDGKRHSTFAGALCGAGALCASLSTLFYQQRLYVVRDMTEELKTNAVVLGNKIGFYPDLVTLVYNKYKFYGADDARSMVTDFNFDLEISSFKNYFLNNVKMDQIKDYIRISVCILVCIVLIILFSKKLTFIPAVGTAGAFLWIFFASLADKFSSLTLALLGMTLCACVCAFLNMTRSSEIEDEECSDEEDDDLAQENGTPTDDNESDFA